MSAISRSAWWGAAVFALGFGLAGLETAGTAAADATADSASAPTASTRPAAGPKRPPARGQQGPTATRTRWGGSMPSGKAPRPEPRRFAAPATVSAAPSAAPAPPPAPPTITMHNNTGQTIWVYNLTTSGDYSIPSDFQPVEIANGSTAPVTLALGTGAVGSPENRIYIVEGSSGFTLPVSSPGGVDAFNPTAPSAGNSFQNYNFLEYYYYSAGDSYQYTFDTSYIDEWSLPIQLQFHKNGADWSGAVDNQVYGFQNYSTVVNQLTVAGAPYSDLVWSGSTPWTPQPPATVSRIIGPDKVWAEQSQQPSTNANMNNAGWVPTSYQNFVQYGVYTDQRTKSPVYPYAWDGTQLSSTGNFNFWKNSVTGPSTTPYPVALHTAAMHDGYPADSNGVYGFFTYPNDEAAGQFTNIPQAVSMDIYVNGTGDGLSASSTPGGAWLYTEPNSALDRLCPGSKPINGTGATDTFFMNSLFMTRFNTPSVAAEGEQNDIVVIVPPKRATSHVVDVVDTAHFGFTADHSSQYVYELSTGYLYYDKNPRLPGYTAVLADLSPSSIDPATAIFVL